MNSDAQAVKVFEQKLQTDEITERDSLKRVDALSGDLRGQIAAQDAIDEVESSREDDDRMERAAQDEADIERLGNARP